MQSRTLKDLLDESFSSYAERTAIRVLQPLNAGEKGRLAYRPMSYRELEDLRNQLATGLNGLGLVKGQRIGILTDGGIEPLVVFLAADMLGVASVPLCSKSPPEILVHTINHSEVGVLVVDAKGYELLESIRPSLEHLSKVILTEGERDNALAWSDLLVRGGEESLPAVEVDPGDESKIVYTSGSSGLPKGVIQTHGNIVANIEEVWDVLSERESLRMFKSAPDYHSMGVLNIYYPLAKGWELDLARSPDRVLSDIRYSEPDAFVTVPLILDKVYGNVRKEIGAGGFKGNLIARAVLAKERLARGQAGLSDRLVHAAIGKKIIEKIRAALSNRVGSRLQMLIVGSAKADPEALDFFQEVLDITTFEGYGTTECAPLIAANHLGGRKTGTVGRPLLEVELVDSQGEKVGGGNPATNTFQGSGEKVGELRVHGPNVMRGYLNDSEQTAKVLVEDQEGKIWYCTGDLFSMDDEGFLTFRGRVGRQFKLRNGEFVNPEVLELIYARSALVEHVLIYGDQSRNFPLPLVVVDVEEAARQTDIPGLPLDDEEGLRCHPALAERIREQLLQEANAAGLPAYERPQKVLLLPEALSEEAGTLTRGLKKVVPKVISERYEELIEKTYAAG